MRLRRSLHDGPELAGASMNAPMTAVRLHRGFTSPPTTGPWHILDMASRPHYYSSGQALCGASMYAGRYRRQDEEKIASLTDLDERGKICPKCRRLSQVVDIDRSEP